MAENVITIPVPILVALFAAVTTCLGGLLTTCAHMLISMKGTIASIDKRIDVRDTKTEGRLLRLEKHDERNQEERDMMLRTQIRTQS